VKLNARLTNRRAKKAGTPYQGNIRTAPPEKKAELIKRHPNRPTDKAGVA